MAFRGRGRGRGGRFGGGGFAKQEPFELFPEIENLGKADGKATTVPKNIYLTSKYLNLERYWNSSPYYFTKEAEGSQKAKRAEIERFSERNSNNTKTKDLLSDFIIMELEYVPAELAKGHRKVKRGRKRVRWNPDSDMRKFDVFEKLEQKLQGEDTKEKQGEDEKEGEDEEENEEVEEEEGEYSSEGDYSQNEDFDDDEDDFNMRDDNDDEPFF